MHDKFCNKASPLDEKRAYKMNGQTIYLRKGNGEHATA